MSISEKDIKDYEDRRKYLVYNKIENLISKLSEIITQIGETGQYVDIDTDIPNIGITINNKLNELSQTFEKAGISMFVEPIEKYDFVDSNFVGEAIMEDMISKVSDGALALSKYNSSIDNMVKQKNEQIKELEEIGPIKKMILKIRSFFVPTTALELTSYSEKEINKVNSHLSEYKEIDEKLWEYNLKDNVAQSIVKLIDNWHYSKSVIPGLLDEAVIPTLQKLGLEDVIPQLQEELNKSQGKSDFFNNKPWELSPTQKLGIQISSERVANEFKQNEKNLVDKEDKDILTK